MSYSTEERGRRIKRLKALSKWLNKAFPDAKWTPSMVDITTALTITKGFWPSEFDYFINFCRTEKIWPSEVTARKHIGSLMTFDEYEQRHPHEEIDSPTVRYMKEMFRWMSKKINGPARRERMMEGITG